MISFSSEHKKRLERAMHNRFLDVCVAKLRALDLPNPYPSDVEQYKAFVEAGYNNAELYGLDDFPHHTYAYILAWHVRGRRFIQYDESLEALFADEYVPSFAKYEILLDMIGENDKALEQIKEMM